jgi:SAM-dependent methyltransferase
MTVYRTRWEFIELFVRGKTVLDVGPAELVGTVNKFKEDRWIHKRVAAVANKVVGLEINEEQVEALVREGYDIRYGDAESFNLKELFDVVLAGEVIEHLSNPGMFLECAKRHLKPKGVLLLTTPNRFNFTQFFQVMKTGCIPLYKKPLAKHVFFFDENSLKDLLIRHGFTQIVIDYYEAVGETPKRLMTRILNRFLRRYRPMFLPGLLVSAGVQSENDA